MLSNLRMEGKDVAQRRYLERRFGTVAPRCGEREDQSKDKGTTTSQETNSNAHFHCTHNCNAQFATFGTLVSAAIRTSATRSTYFCPSVVRFFESLLLQVIYLMGCALSQETSQDSVQSKHVDEYLYDSKIESLLDFKILLLGMQSRTNSRVLFECKFLCIYIHIHIISLPLFF